VTDKLVALLFSVTRGNAEITLEELFEVFDFPPAESTLAKILKTKDKVATLGLRLIPDVASGELDSVRRLDFPESAGASKETMREDIGRPESSIRELKSSLLYDHKRALHDRNASGKDLRSEEVLHSSLKTICAFLNTSGGVLYVGVDDERRVLGIEYDFSCMTNAESEGNRDTWELLLRDLVRARFKEGPTVNDYLSCQFAEIDARLVARIQVAARGSLSFLRKKDGFQLFRRQGNRTEQVFIEEMEEFIGSRRIDAS
jgi:Putative DNA-binding domain